VGGGGKGSPMPLIYADWDVVWLDLNPSLQPDLLMDARDLGTLEPEQFDAVFSSHCLEHIYPHDLRALLHGAWHALKENGFMDVVVPNTRLALQRMVEDNLDLDSFLYHSAGGPICVRDTLWGYARYQEFSHHPELHIHKNGFSKRTLANLLMAAEFSTVYVIDDSWDLRVLAFKRKPEARRLESLGVAVSND
jgi:hypothetical protein